MSLQADSQASMDALGHGLLNLLVFEKLKNKNKLVGLDCSPIAALDATCNNQPLCCEDNYQNGLIAVGCNNLLI